MRHIIKSVSRAAAPTYCFDTDSAIERVIRDPIAALLGRRLPSVVQESGSCDPYNRVGRLARRRYTR